MSVFIQFKRLRWFCVMTACLCAAVEASSASLPADVAERFPGARITESRTAGEVAERLLQTETGRWVKVREHGGDRPGPRGGGGAAAVREYFAAGDLVVRAAGRDLPAGLERMLAARGFVRQRMLPLSGLMVFRNPQPRLADVGDARARLRARYPHVEVFENRLFFPTAVPNDPDYSLQWALAAVDAAGGWDVSTGAQEIVVAVIDTGVFAEHVDFMVPGGRNIFTNPGEIAGDGIDNDGNGYIDDVHGWDFGDEDNDPNDTSGHGTQVAGIIGAAGNNGVGISGVNWRVSILPLRAGGGTFLWTDLVECHHYVIDLRLRGIPVVATNNSYGALVSQDYRSPTGDPLYEAMKFAGQLGVLAVCGAGNNGRDIDGLDGSGNPQQFVPASFDLDAIISVAGTANGDTWYTSSNYGTESVDLAAPAVSVRTLSRSGGYSNGTGTSFAAPHVAGAVALARAANPYMDAMDIRRLIIDSGDPLAILQTRTASGRRLDLANLMQAAKLDGDPDGDGLTNAEEHAFGRAPLRPDGAPVRIARGQNPPEPLAAPDGDSSYLYLDYTRAPGYAAAVSFEAAPDLDAPSWAPIEPDLDETIATDPDTGVQTRRAWFLWNRTEGWNFVRMRVDL